MLYLSLLQDKVFENGIVYGKKREIFGGNLYIKGTKASTAPPPPPANALLANKGNQPYQQ